MKVKELRIKNKLTQKELAQKINISDVNYNRYEVGKVKFDLETLIKLADYYNVSLDYLCDRQWNNQVGYIPEEKKEVVKIILLLNETNTLKLFGYASGLLANQN